MMMQRVIWILGICFCLCGGSAWAADDLRPVKDGGKPAPALKLSDMKGNIHDLADLRGKVVMVQFWATYCPPCVKEMPSVDRLAKRFQGKPFAIMAVNLGEPESEIRKFLEKVPVGFPILLDPSGDAVKNWKVFAAPSTFVIDPEGKVRYTLFGGAEWDAPQYVEALSALMPKEH